MCGVLRQVIVIDEIGGTDEVKAVKTIAQRGVVLVATAHGVSLTNLIQNPDLNGLVGGVCQVTVGDAAAKGYVRHLVCRPCILQLSVLHEVCAALVMQLSVDGASRKSANCWTKGTCSRQT